MKTYEYYGSSPDGWKVNGTLELDPNGYFSYSEGWTDYTNASLSGGAGGTWRRGEGILIFRADKVYPTMYFPWTVGWEVTATVRGDELDFPNGWTFSLETDELHEIPVHNEAAKPMPLVLEPWGIRRTLAPGERVRIVTQGNFWYGQFDKVEYRADEIVYRGSITTWATIVPEPATPPPAPPPEPPPPAPKPAPAAKTEPADKPTVEPAATPQVKPPTRPAAPPFVPRAPSPELAALLRRWIDELPTEGLENWLRRLCKDNDALPLGGTEIYMWMLRTDGQVLCVDHEGFRQPAEPEEDAVVAYDMIELGARTHPELSELLPPDRRPPG